MKIIYTIAATHNSGGMERVLANKANYLATLGYQITIVTTDQEGKPPFFPFKDTIKHYDLEINYARNNGMGLLKKLQDYPQKKHQHRRKLAQILHREKPDIVISMFDGDAEILPTIKDGSKKILEIHFSRFKRLQYNRSGLWRIIDRYRTYQDKKIATKYDQFVVLTHEDRHYWGDMNNICVIPNANTFPVPQQVAELTNPVAIAVGRLEYQKGFEDMIQAWHILHQKHADKLWQLHIYGDGSLRETLQEMIAQYGLDHLVKLYPPTENIQDRYLSSSLFLMTSRYEGLPMSMLEAQSCGLPLLSYACKCGPKDIIKDGCNGFLIPPGDMDLLATKAEQVMCRPDLRNALGRESRSRAHRFDEAQIMQRWIDLFNQTLAKR